MDSNKPILLYVEDDVNVVEDVTFLIKSYFDEIAIVHDGALVMERFLDVEPDIIILDINIPNIDGLELARRIREHNRDVPIMFLTAFSEREKLLKAINIGVSNYLVKPFDISELKSMIENLIAKVYKGTVISLAHDFTWSKDTSRLFYKNREFVLTKKEVKLIEVLSENRQQYFSACDIASELFVDKPQDNKCSNVVKLISRFRKKVLQFFEIDTFFIENIYGMGYSLPNQLKSQ